VDDVVNVSGHRLSTAEIEAALLEHRKPAARPPKAKGNPLISYRPSRRSSCRRHQ